MFSRLVSVSVSDTRLEKQDCHPKKERKKKDGKTGLVTEKKKRKNKEKKKHINYSLCMIYFVVTKGQCYL